jgi:ribonuclease P protein component
MSQALTDSILTLTKMTFPKSVRLNRQEEFRDALDNGRKVVCGDMILFCRPDVTQTRKQSPALGLIVSRKVGPSVIRNKVKRNLRESFRMLRPELADMAAFQNKNIVIIARSTLAKKSQAEVADSLQACLKRLKRQEELAKIC